MYIWQHAGWPNLHYDATALASRLSAMRHAQGYLLGRMSDVGLELRRQANLQMLTEDVLKTSEIEGERLNLQTVRSSVARRLGMDIGALAPADRNVEGVVDMVLDATAHHDQPLTAKRLFAWHAALFPTGYSGMARINTGAWRNDASGPMQVVSGPIGRRKVHYQAPPAARLKSEMPAFLKWFNARHEIDDFLKAGLAHVIFVTIHPVDDGNGRIARALSDMMLARAEGSAQRFYSLSAQIQRERRDYYDLLERTQKGALEVTPWLDWFLGCLLRSVESAHVTLAAVLTKARFWQRWTGTPMNERQIKLLNALLDGIDGKLSNAKWAAIGKCSADTALRDITNLLTRGVLRKTGAGGRSTSYELAPDNLQPPA